MTNTAKRHVPYYIHTWKAKGVEVSFQELLKERVQDLLTKIQNLILKLKVLRLKYQGMGQG